MPYTEIPAGPLITLSYRVAPEQRELLLAFLRRAFPRYESPGGLRMGLYEDRKEPNRFLELVAYSDEASYAADQKRIEQEPEMQALLAEWRALLDGSLEVGELRPLLLGEGSPPDGLLVEEASLNYYEAIRALLVGAALPLPSPLDERVSMLILREGREVIACAGYERYGEYALLRSVAVQEAARGKGLGRRLLEGTCERLRHLGVSTIFLLTLNAGHFFERLGFSSVDLAHIPKPVLRSQEFSLPCCKTASYWSRKL